ncbi:kynureninase [Sphingomonas antarctica]|uniref:kynureninase n=1 Tax=Sphingomonas antarctica TaxID=2040274 RepID=UPI0039EBD9F0
MPTLEDAQALDRADPLAAFRQRFSLPENVIYLDGNSLGPLPVETPRRVAEAVAKEWGDGLVTSWNDAGWVDAPHRIGDKIARVIGARPGEVVVTDSTSVNLYKLIMAAAPLSPGRTEILTERGNFPSDLYVAEGAARTLGLELRVVDRDDLVGAMSSATALVMLTQVDYRSGYRHDIAAMNRIAAGHDVRIVWDLSHSIGTVPLDLGRDGVELAIGCGYKHLNGGPGAPAFLYVAKALQDKITSPISGWFGHASPFVFDARYQPAPGISRFLAGTPPILSMVALEAGVDLMLEVDQNALFAKSAQLFDLFALLVAARCPELRPVSPDDPATRGGHISFAHDHAYEIIQALIARGVIGDFRTPDVARFGITPLYTRFEDIWRAVDILDDIMARKIWQEPQYAVRRVVT